MLRPPPPRRTRLTVSSNRQLYAPASYVSSASSVRQTREEIEAQIQDMEERLQTLGDDAQLANIDLQSALQRTQQTLQMLSNVSKMMHDTAMEVIRKIG